MTPDLLRDEARKLTLDQREALVEQLLRDLAADAPDEVTAAWNAEVQVRREALARGDLNTVSWDEARALLRDAARRR